MGLNDIRRMDMKPIDLGDDLDTSLGLFISQLEYIRGRILRGKFWAAFGRTFAYLNPD